MQQWTIDSWRSGVVKHKVNNQKVLFFSPQPRTAAVERILPPYWQYTATGGAGAADPSHVWGVGHIAVYCLFKSAQSSAGDVVFLP